MSASSLNSARRLGVLVPNVTARNGVSYSPADASNVLFRISAPRQDSESVATSAASFSLACVLIPLATRRLDHLIL
ncbi:hypothetical protein PG985_006168 [Apiospora marii]|uniref:Uncharacterized protein n=1 Tax=Apiospora marii TaxID=335849 RepID=A0ABR1S791_9PEZI